MKYILLSICLSILAAVSAGANPDFRAKDGLERIGGQWQVSLYFSSDQPPSGTTMELRVKEDGSLEGTFYGSIITTGRVATFEGDVIFTAVTEDSSGPYLHSGRLRGDVIEGQTLSTGRDFLMPWRAKRSGAE